MEVKGGEYVLKWKVARKHARAHPLGAGPTDGDHLQRTSEPVRPTICKHLALELVSDADSMPMFAEMRGAPKGVAEKDAKKMDMLVLADVFFRRTDDLAGRTWLEEE